MIKINPIGDKIVVRPKEFSNLKSGLTIPKSEDKKRPEQGTIVAISKSVPKDICLKVGDLVLFDKYNADAYEVNDIEYLILNYGDIHAQVLNK
jgi:chaperonin GroES